MNQREWEAQQEIIRRNREQHKAWVDHLSQLAMDRYALSRHRMHRFTPVAAISVSLVSVGIGLSAGVMIPLVLGAVSAACWSAALFSRWTVDNCDICARKR